MEFENINLKLFVLKFLNLKIRNIRSHFFFLCQFLCWVQCSGRVFKSLNPSFCHFIRYKFKGDTHVKKSWKTDCKTNSGDGYGYEFD